MAVEFNRDLDKYFDFGVAEANANDRNASGTVVVSNKQGTLYYTSGRDGDGDSQNFIGNYGVLALNTTNGQWIYELIAAAPGLADLPSEEPSTDRSHITLQDTDIGERLKTSIYEQDIIIISSSTAELTPSFDTEPKLTDAAVTGNDTDAIITPGSFALTDTTGNVSETSRVVNYDNDWPSLSSR